MKRVAAIAVCGLTLSACSSMPGWLELPKPAPPTTTMQFESRPPGAEARTSTGGACRTPCSIPVAGEQFTVTFSLPGYQPQTIPVRMTTGDEPVNPDSEPSSTPRMVPNPVYAELLPIAPAKKKAAPPRPKKVSAPKAAPPPAGPAPAPAPAAAWPPPPAR